MVRETWLGAGLAAQGAATAHVVSQAYAKGESRT